MNKCDSCGKEFPSNEELEYHHFIEAIQKQSKRQVREFSFIASGLLTMNILTVQKRDHCNIDEAIKTFWEETVKINQTWNRMFREQPGSQDAPDDAK